MKLTVNLATRPFVELRPLLVRLRIVMAALAGLAIILFIVQQVLAAHTAKAVAAMQSIQQQTQAVLAERASNEHRMQQPDNAALLRESKYLNGLFAHKAFSWTEVMMDLETVLPGGVQVMSIDPQIDKTGSVVLKIHVAGDRMKAVEFVENLEQSKHFRDAQLSDETMQGQENNQGNRMPVANTTGVEFNVFAGYNPMLLHDVHEENNSDTPKDAAPTAPRPVVKSAPKKAKPKTGIIGQGISRPTPVPQGGAR